MFEKSLYRKARMQMVSGNEQKGLEILAKLMEKKPDIDKMREGAEKLFGTHDFKGFSSLGKTKKSTVRTINSIEITEADGIISVKINGSGFLYNMVRIVVGTLLEIGTGELPVSIIDTVFEGKTRAQAGTTLPARGLKLTEVFY